VKVNSEHVMGPIGSFRKTAGIQKRKKERKKGRHNSSICPHLAHHYSSLEFGFCTSKGSTIIQTICSKGFSNEDKRCQICGSTQNFLHLLLLYLEFEQND
jgi:hypothetical protein